MVPVSPLTGSVEASSVAAAIRPETCLVTVMLANNETGVVQPIKDICEVVREMIDLNCVSVISDISSQLMSYIRDYQ